MNQDKVDCGLNVIVTAIVDILSDYVECEITSSDTVVISINKNGTEKIVNLIQGISALANGLQSC